MSKISKTDEQWRSELSPEEYEILRKKGTERAFTGEYCDTKTKGTYLCRGCDAELFVSDTKFDSGCGWPSFHSSIEEGIDQHRDISHGMERVEVTCSRCGSHMGHVFPDGPAPTGQRFCINSASIKLREEK